MPRVVKNLQQISNAFISVVGFRPSRFYISGSERQHAL